MNYIKRAFSFALACTSMAIWTSDAIAAQPFPSRPLTLVVQATAGGASDIVARQVTQKMSESLGQAVVIVNQPAAGGNVAVQTVVNAKPDGYTMLWLGTKSAIAESLFKMRPFNLNKGLTAVAFIGGTDLAVVVPSTSRLGNMQELLQEIKAKQGKLTIGVGDVPGGIQHLSAELFKSAVQGDFLIVPFGSASKLVTAIRGGDVDVGIELVPPLMGQIRSGDLRALAVTGEKRVRVLSDVPTLAEAGIKDSEVSANSFIAVPAGTPPAVIEQLNRALLGALQDPELQARLDAMGSSLAGIATPANAQARLEQEVLKWREVVRLAKVEQL